MAFYILKSGICLAIFYGFYKLVLEKESFHVFKRFYLLVSAVLAFVIPLITFTEYIEVIPQEIPLLFSQTSLTNTIIETDPINYLPIILWSIYGLGVLLFSFKFLKNLSGLIIKIKRNPKFKNQSFINVLLEDFVIPHTFFNYIFLNKQKFEAHQIPKEVLLHEETHAKQKHSLDVLFIELLQILFWFNPIVYFIKYSIKLNHEFLADQAVLRKGAEPLKYQSLLLAFSSNASEPQLANAINYSSIKKRFTVMNTHTSKKAFWLRSLILLPLLAILIYSFSEKKVIEKPFVAQQNISANGVTEPMMKEYRDFINDFENSNRIIHPNYLRSVAIYDLMTEEQRASVKKYPENILSNISNVKPKSPTETEFNSWKDAGKFAVWLDGKHINNSELNNYSTSDIKYFTTSFVYNNARSVKFPQPHQNHLYTQKGFEEAYLKSNAKKYNSIKAEYLKAIEENNISSDEQKILKAQMDRAFENLTEEEIEKYNIIKVTSSKNPIQRQVTPEEIDEFNTLVKKFNSKPEKERIIRVKDKNRIEYIYSLMTSEQKKENEAFPNFVTIAPLPIPYNASQDLKTYINERKKATDFIEKHKIDYPLGYLELSESKQKEFMNLYKAMSLAFNNLPESEKQTALKILPPPPSAEMYKLENGKLVKKQDVPPPPPPLETALPQNPSKELLEAKKKFLEKANIYGEAMQVYFKEKKGDLSDLRKMYDDVMVLYNEYSDLRKKENAIPPPPPPVKK